MKLLYRTCNVHQISASCLHKHAAIERNPRRSEHLTTDQLFSFTNTLGTCRTQPSTITRTDFLSGELDNAFDSFSFEKHRCALESPTSHATRFSSKCARMFAIIENWYLSETFDGFAYFVGVFGGCYAFDKQRLSPHSERPGLMELTH